MADSLHKKILELVKSEQYRPVRPQKLARELELADTEYHAFRDALRELMDEGRVVLGARGAVLVPSGQGAKDLFVGTYRQNRRGFGFVIPTDPAAKEDLFIPPGEHGGALTGDTVRAQITSRGQREGKSLYTGRITEIIKRGNSRFVGTLVKQGTKRGTEWMVLPDGNALTEPIRTPDAASRHIKPGTKVVVELTQYPEDGLAAQGVIDEVLGHSGEKDVDLKSVIVQHNLPGPFPEEVREQARETVANFNPSAETGHRYDLSDEVICTIDPPDAKDYDDAISLRQLDNGNWELGVHIADVSHFVPEGSPLDVEARERGNSAYFPGYVIPMLPEVLSNGVCSLQEGVARLCKSAFITYDRAAKPIATKFANTIIKSANRLRYIEAQAIIDGAKVIPHPDGDKRIKDYPPEVVTLLQQMDALAKRLRQRRLEQGQINLDLPEVELVLDEQGKVIDAVPEDTSFTHTLIEMFMVEANEAVARLLDSLDVPFLRRVHPEPEGRASDKLRNFAHVAGYDLPKTLDRHAIQALLTSVRGKPEAFAINLAVLKSLTRAEYSPAVVGHYALASTNYCHFTSPIRRYADLTIHRLLDRYFEAREAAPHAKGAKRRKKVVLEDVPSEEELIELGRHISYTERRAEDAERELRQVKILELLKDQVGEEFKGVVTGITNFGLFIQIQAYLIDGLIRYEYLLDDWWDVDERAGTVRGQRTGTKIGIGDPVKVVVARVDVPRRELDLRITELIGKPNAAPQAIPARPSRGQRGGAPRAQGQGHKRSAARGRGKQDHTGGETQRNQQSKQRSRRKR
jgi:ribonuclease R